MKRLTQNSAPIYEALKRHKAKRVVPFDVPGHKGGRATPELTEFLGASCVKADVNAMKPLDNLCHPTSVIRDAEILAAEAFGARAAFFMVSGTSGSVQAMIMAACKTGEKIIMPRNVHRSAIHALVICGAVPVYVNPGVDERLGIALGMSADGVKDAMDAHPDAKAVLMNNPTYYGVCPDVRKIVRMARERGMLTLVDEAHGTHFYFGGEPDMPVSGMAAGADMAAVSMHKTGGSLTQSSMLLCGPAVNAGYVRQVINLTQTTSGSYLLLSSLDLARRNLALNGAELFKRVSGFADYARWEINKLGGYRAFGADIVNGDTVYAFDPTKLSVNTLDIGLAGVEVYDLLRDEYDIQIEFGDMGNILAILSWGDRELELERLISALSEIKRLYSRDRAGLLDHEYVEPQMVCPPQTAFYGRKETLPIREALGRVSGEFVMCYPPGIPIVAPGEVLTRSALDYILYAKEKGSLLTGPQDMAIEFLQVLGGA